MKCVVICCNPVSPCDVDRRTIPWIDDNGEITSYPLLSKSRHGPGYGPVLSHTYSSLPITWINQVVERDCARSPVIFAHDDHISSCDSAIKSTPTVVYTVNRAIRVDCWADL